MKNLLAFALCTALIACGDDSASPMDAGPSVDGGPGADTGNPMRDGGVIGIGPVQGFDVAMHGFGFENYTNMSMPTNLTSEEMRIIYGDQVCARIEGENCILKPQARAHMEQINHAMGGGHCEGMAVMSLTLFHGLQAPMDFGGNLAADLRLDGNMALTRSIAFWWAMQVPLQNERIVGTPNEQIERLRQSFADGATENYTIAFFTRAGKGGHAVTPFALQDMGDGQVQIMVYDNNFPGVARAIVVNTAANTWMYEASQNPGDPSSLYDGDAMTGNLQLVALSARFRQHPCSFCGDAMTGMSSQRTVASAGEGDVLITDPSGARLGFVDGTLVNEISGANAVPLMSDDLFADDQDPLYLVPGGTDLTVSLSGGDLEAATPSSLTLSGAGYLVGVSDVVLDPGQEDLVVFPGAFPGVYYETESSETATVEVAVETAAADWDFAIRSRGDSAGQAVNLQADLEQGDLIAVFDGNDAESEFDLFIERIDEEGSIVFYDENIVVPNGAVLFITYADFDADGESLILAVDLDDDGEIDDEIMLVDEG